CRGSIRHSTSLALSAMVGAAGFHGRRSWSTLIVWAWTPTIVPTYYSSYGRWIGRIRITIILIRVRAQRSVTPPRKARTKAGLVANDLARLRRLGDNWPRVL